MSDPSLTSPPRAEQSSAAPAGVLVLLAFLALSLADNLLWSTGSPEPRRLAFYWAGVLAAQFLMFHLVGRVSERRSWSAGIELSVAVVVTGLASTPIAMILFGDTAASSGVGLAGIAFGVVVETVMTLGVWILALRYPMARARAEHVARLLREAELSELRARLQPHFLSNSLNMISSLVAAEPERARELIATLGDLLRELSVETAASRPLRAELDWSRRYTELLEARHDGGLFWSFEVDDAALDTEVPSFLLQPLFENALVHSAGAPEPRRVHVAIAREADRVRIVVESPVGRPRAEGAGAGLSLVRRRLALWSRAAALHTGVEGRVFVSEIVVPAARWRNGSR